MADGFDPQGFLTNYFNTIAARRQALSQPMPQQGGILANADPVMLSLAAGLLSPTKTGGFGESVGLGLQAAQGPLSEIRKQEQARLDKMQALEDAEAALALKMYDIQSGGSRGYKPDDPLLRYNRYIDGRAAAEANLQNAIDAKDQKAIDRWNKSIQNLDAEAEIIFGAKAVSEVKKGTADGGGESKETEDKGLFPVLNSVEEASKLPSGTIFYTPDGRRKKVP